MVKRGLLIPAVVVACLSIVLTTRVFATERPCRADIERFCADVSRGGGRIAACLRQHYSELSSECKARGRELHERVQEAREACREDISKYCKEMQPGRGRVVSCLKEHGPDLSTDCRAALKPTR